MQNQEQTIQEKPETLGTQDIRQNTNKTQYVLDTTAQPNTNNVSKKDMIPPTNN